MITKKDIKVIKRLIGEREVEITRECYLHMVKDVRNAQKSDEALITLKKILNELV